MSVQHGLVLSHQKQQCMSVYHGLVLLQQMSVQHDLVFSEQVRQSILAACSIHGTLMVTLSLTEQPFFFPLFSHLLETIIR